MAEQRAAAQNITLHDQSQVNGTFVASHLEKCQVNHNFTFNLGDLDNADKKESESATGRLVTITINSAYPCRGTKRKNNDSFGPAPPHKRQRANPPRGPSNTKPVSNYIDLHRVHFVLFASFLNVHVYIVSLCRFLYIFGFRDRDRIN